MTYLIANWKSFVNNTQSVVWLNKIEKLLPTVPPNLKVIICLPFTDLPEFNRHLNLSKTPFSIGAQTVSSYPAGKHTGDITASMLSELVTHCLVGHSERRTHHKESNQNVAEQAKRLLDQNITPIVCIDKSNIDEQVKQLFTLNVSLSRCIIAYEPVSAIGSGQPESLGVVKKVVAKITLLTNETPILYGGSVSPDNLLKFTNQPSISGVLVGTSSLDPLIFSQLIKLLA